VGELNEKTDRRFTYGDYLTWPEEERWELINGEAYAMSPAPGRRHQDILGKLFYTLYSFFEGNPCKVFLSPFDVRLPDYPDQADEEIETVVQPDLLVVCDPKKLDERGCRGAPDLVIEILSSSTAARDLREKLLLYERQGVREYWVVYPTEKIVMVFLRDEKGAFGKPFVYASEEAVSSNIFEGLVVDLKTVFSEE